MDLSRLGDSSTHSTLCTLYHAYAPERRPAATGSRPACLASRAVAEWGREAPRAWAVVADGTCGASLDLVRCAPQRSPPDVTGADECGDAGYQQRGVCVEVSSDLAATSHPNVTSELRGPRSFTPAPSRPGPSPKSCDVATSWRPWRRDTPAHVPAPSLGTNVHCRLGTGGMQEALLDVLLTTCHA